MTRSVVSLIMTAAAAFAVLSTLSSPSSAQDLKTDHTLYARVGGYDFIARFVDSAFPRVAAQPQLHRLFQGHSIDSQLRQRQLIVDALCKEMAPKAGGASRVVSKT